MTSLHHSTTQVLLTAAVVCFAVIQASFAFSIRHLDPKRDYLSPVPSARAQDAMAFGDPEFLERMFALEVQNAGDTGGRIVPIKNYDFRRVVGWLEVLERLDPRSNFALGMAGGFFGLSQDVRNVAPIVRFMMRDVARDPPQRWRALFDAIYLARHRLHDDKLALDAARQLAAYDFPGIDPWATMTPAFILEDDGDYEGAMAVVRDTLRRLGPRMSKDDAGWAASYLNFLAKVERGEVPPRRKTWK